MTGDQRWFLYRYEHNGKWCSLEENNPIANGSKIIIKKIVVTVIWGVWEFPIIDIMPEGQSFNSLYFIENIILPLYNEKTKYWAEADERKMWLYLDNCKVHNSKSSMKTISDIGFKRAPHPPYSPDVAPSDFFLFGYTKNKLKVLKFDSQDDLKEAIIQIFSMISHEKRIQAFDE